MPQGPDPNWPAAFADAPLSAGDALVRMNLRGNAVTVMPTPSLATDAYKFSMAQAGFPLRRETFYFSFRRGGPQFIPFDLASCVRDLVEGLTVTDADLRFARQTGYGFSDAMEAALTRSQALEIVSVPRGVWVQDREPIFSVRGPSFLVSWLEPMLLWLAHPIQLATALKRDGELPPEGWVATCAEHADLIERVVAEVGGPAGTISIESDAYRDRVRQTVRSLVQAAGNDPARIFEVGMRSAVCMEQHRIALEACQAEGVIRTSNVHLAQQLGMVPVGTMGHEHVQRWGADLPAFQAMRDMRSAPPSYLLDTFDTMGSGIGAAVQVMRQREHACSIRYDSGNKYIQYLHACELLNEAELQPAHVLEDGLDVEATRHFESLREFTRWPAEKQIYGFGGTIVAGPMTNPYTRDRISAVFKLAETDNVPRMKFGNDRGLGKQSVPGHPVLWRRLRGRGPLGVIAQADEVLPDDYVRLSGNPDSVEHLRLCNAHSIDRVELVGSASVYSPATEKLVAMLRLALQRRLRETDSR